MLRPHRHETHIAFWSICLYASTFHRHIILILRLHHVKLQRRVHARQRYTSRYGYLRHGKQCPFYREPFLSWDLQWRALTFIETACTRDHQHHVPWDSTPQATRYVSEGGFLLTGAVADDKGYSYRTPDKHQWCVLGSRARDSY